MQLRNQKGFTLIEIAIVLTIVGLVIGGIWLAASTVLNNNKKSELSRQVVQIVQNTKNLFANQTGASPATNFSTDTARNAGVFPAGMVAGNFVRHPFATTLTANSVTLDQVPGNGNRLQLVLGTGANPMPRDACIELVTRVATQENFSRYGIFSVNGLTAGATVQNLSATCAVADPGNNPVTIQFNVP